MGLGSSTAFVLAAAALMLLAAIDKRRLVFGAQRRCRRCHRELRSCSCPRRHRRRLA